MLIPVVKGKLLVQYLQVKFCLAMQKVHNSLIFVLAKKEKKKKPNKHKRQMSNNKQITSSGYPEMHSNPEHSLTDLVFNCHKNKSVDFKNKNNSFSLETQSLSFNHEILSYSCLYSRWISYLVYSS